MSLRIEENWKWTNKTLPRTLCVVSTSDETTHCGICLTSNKNLQSASWENFEPKFAFFALFRKQANS